MRRVVAAVVTAVVLWIPLSVHTAVAVYCYPGDPPEVYQACVAYNQGIGQQVSSEQQLQAVMNGIITAEGQINAIIAIIKNLDAQIAAQKDLIAKTQNAIDELDRKIRFTEASLTRLHAQISVRGEVLNQRLRYVDDHGSVNYVELVLSANTFNDLMNRMIGAQQVAASDRKLSDQYRQLGVQRKAIDAQVAALQLKYEAAAQKAGGGTGQFEWPEPACGFGCISQGYGCVTFYLEIYDPSCPYPHRKHTGIDIAAAYRSPIVAADTGIIYLYPGSIGYGNMIMMIHGNGYSTIYGHLAGYAGGISSGQIVARGDLIGYEGSTGWSTGPHLHFEIRVNNDPRDPCIWLGC